MLSATPYNKTFLDLSNQLPLFLSAEEGIGVRPEKFIREKGELELLKLQISPRSLAAFERSEFADDWARVDANLSRQRTLRSFIQENYAKLDPSNDWKYLEFADGTRSYFPTRVPKTVKFTIDPNDQDDQYARLFADDVLKTVNNLTLPRDGLGNYQKPSPQ